MGIVVATSTVADGSLYNRTDPTDTTIIQNRRAFLSKYAISIEQSVRLKINFKTDDFCRYKAVNATHAGKGMQDDTSPLADAIITTERYLALFLPVADCIGAAIYDPEHGVLALAHLGRHSLQQHGAYKIIHHLIETYGTHPNKLQLWLTPAVSKAAYQIWKLDNKGMKEAAFEQFAEAGVEKFQIHDNPTGTDIDKSYYSYSEYLKGNRPVDGDHGIVAVLT
jgi:copper oxidase (laccase) domain-containing protein